MNSRSVSVGMLETNCYIVDCDDLVLVIDPGDDVDRIIDALDGRTPTHIVLTHSHSDHVGAAKALHDRYPSSKVACGDKENMDPEHIAEEARYVLGSSFSQSPLARKGWTMPDIDMLLSDGSELGPFVVMHTPGHSSGSICLYAANPGVLYSGDTLFRHSYGRTDIGGSDSQMFLSLIRLMKKLPPDTVVYPGHGDSTTIGSEKAYFRI
ncbi:MAG: MBL fold metallo-hydrolase [Spirochaetales bacterium]|nr:MBL fold metallo-hydrolase [Spirochaetales bacterium]